jgi:hypothetical protein
LGLRSKFFDDDVVTFIRLIDVTLLLVVPTAATWFAEY